jgi:SAM-dependent methyltransferase
MSADAGKRGEVEQMLEDVRSLYSDSISRYGTDARSVGWHDRESQELRFEKLAYLLDADPWDGPFTVNDLGCGYGEMFRFLDARCGSRMERYHGYDISADMLDAARSHISDPRVELIESSDLERPADYSFVSGTFHVRRGADEDAWREYVERMIRRMSEQSTRGFAFNLFTSYVDFRNDDLFYADPAEFFSFCRRELSRYVTLLHDYPLYEWTIVVLQERALDSAR